MSGNNRIGLVACGLCLAFALAGCGSGSKGFTDSSQGKNPLLGTWLKRSLTFGDRSVSCPNSIDNSLDKSVTSVTQNNVVIDACGFDESVTFNADGTYKFIIPEPRFVHKTIEDGTYKVSGNTITLTRTKTSYDANGDNTIQSSEITTLTSVTDPNNVPLHPKQRVVLTYSISNGALNLTTVAQPTKDSNGVTIINSDKTVNAPVPGTTIEYGVKP